MESAAEPVVVCSAVSPYPVLWASESWLQLCGFGSLDKIVGQTLECINGPGTGNEALAVIKQAVGSSRSCTVRLINYHYMQRVPFMHTVAVEPVLASDGTVSRFHATSTEVAWLGQQPRPSPTPISSSSDDCSAWGDSAETSFDDLEDLSCGTHSGVSLPLYKQPVQAIFATKPVSVITQAEPPYAALWASHAWMQLCGLVTAELAGRPLKIIQGPGTDRAAIDKLMSAVREGRSCSGIQLVNYHKSGSSFRHSVSIELKTNSEGQPFYFATSNDVHRLGLKHHAGDSESTDLPGDSESMDSACCEEVMSQHGFKLAHGLQNAVVA